MAAEVGLSLWKSLCIWGLLKMSSVFSLFLCLQLLYSSKFLLWSGILLFYCLCYVFYCAARAKNRKPCLTICLKCGKLLLMISTLFWKHLWTVILIFIFHNPIKLFFIVLDMLAVFWKGDLILKQFFMVFFVAVKFFFKTTTFSCRNCEEVWFTENNTWKVQNQ